MKKMILNATAFILPICLYSSELSTESRYGTNLVVIHEYGSKKIFANGSLAMGSSADVATDTTQIGIKHTPYDPTAAKNYIGVKPVKDIKFYDTRPEHYSYFVNSSAVDSYMTTSFYFTGEGKLDEGGIHSPNFKKKFNLNNFLYYCDKEYTKDCRNTLLKFDIRSAQYISVRNNTYQNAIKDKAIWNKISNLALNEPIDGFTKKSITKKVEELNNFLELVWAIKPSYYDDYKNNLSEPYMLMTNNPFPYPPQGVGLKFTNKYNQASQIKGSLPYYFYGDSLNLKGTDKYPYFAVEGDKKKLVIPRYNSYSSKTGGYNPRDADNMVFDLSSLDTSIFEIGLISTWLHAKNVAGYSIYHDFTQRGVGGHRIHGNYQNRDEYGRMVANYMLYAKSESNSLDKAGNYNQFKNADSDKIASFLSKTLINSVRIIERNYGVGPKPYKNGTNFKARSTFTAMSDTFSMENLLKKESIKPAYISKINQYINLNREDFKLPTDERSEAMHSHEAEGVYSIIDNSVWYQGNNIALPMRPYPGKKDDHMGSKRYTSEFALHLFANMNDFVLGYNTKNHNVPRYSVISFDKTGTVERKRDDVVIPLLSTLAIPDDYGDENDISTTPNGIPNLDRWLEDEDPRYSSLISCLLDSVCFMSLVDNAGTYKALDEAIKARLQKDEYPLKLSILRSIQAPYLVGENGIYQFLGPNYDRVEGYSGVYEEVDGGPRKYYCVYLYKPGNQDNKFIERRDLFSRYKQHSRDNWFYLAKNEPDNALKSNGQVVIKSDVVQTSSITKPEEYSVGNPGAIYLYGEYADLGQGSSDSPKCPTHNDAYSLPKDQFTHPQGVSTRPDWMHEQVLYYKGAKELVEKIINDNKTIICGANGTGASEAGISCTDLIAQLPNYVLNIFTSNDYLSIYEGNYIIKEGKVDPLNSLGTIYTVEDPDSVAENRNNKSKENKLKDAARFVIEEVTKRYYKHYDIGLSPKNDKRGILLKNAPMSAPSVSFDWDVNSTQNRCAKRLRLGDRNPTGNNPLEKIDCEFKVAPPPPPPPPPPTPPTPACVDRSYSFFPTSLHYKVPKPTWFDDWIKSGGKYKGVDLGGMYCTKTDGSRYRPNFVSSLPFPVTITLGHDPIIHADTKSCTINMKCTGGSSTPPPPAPTCDLDFKIWPNTSLANPYYTIPDKTNGRSVKSAKITCYGGANSGQSKSIGTSFPQRMNFDWRIAVCNVHLDFCGSTPPPPPPPPPTPPTPPKPPKTEPRDCGLKAANGDVRVSGSRAKIHVSDFDDVRKWGVSSSSVYMARLASNTLTCKKGGSRAQVQANCKRISNKEVSCDISGSGYKSCEFIGLFYHSDFAPSNKRRECDDFYKSNP